MFRMNLIKIHEAEKLKCLKTFIPETFAQIIICVCVFV